MSNRLSLHAELRQVMTSLNLTPNVYYQPPETVKINYPCIIYNRNKDDVKYASNMTYRHTRSYELTVIDKNADSNICDTILKRFPMCRIDKHYVSDNLYHDSLNLYY